MKTTNSNNQFTPGPWAVSKDFELSAKESDLAIYDAQWQTKICRIESFYTSKFALSPLSDECQANARLIAASPDLLNALEIAIASLNRLACTPAKEESIQGTLSIARAAIAKATKGE